MAFPSKSFSSFQTKSNWALDVALYENPATYDLYSPIPSIPENRSSDLESDCSSDDEYDLDPHGFYSSYWIHSEVCSSDFSQPSVAAGSIIECGHGNGSDSEEIRECSGDECSTGDPATASSPAPGPSTRVGSYYDDGFGLDEEVEREIEDGTYDDDNDEYILVSEIPTSKKRRAASQLDRSTPRLCSSSSSSSSPTSARLLSDSPTPAQKRPRKSFQARNIQGTAEKPLEQVEKADPLACPVLVCPKVFTRMPDLRRHLETHQVRGKKFICDGCLSHFSRKDSLSRHRRKCRFLDSGQ